MIAISQGKGDMLLPVRGVAVMLTGIMLFAVLLAS